MRPFAQEAPPAPLVVPRASFASSSAAPAPGSCSCFCSALVGSGSCSRFCSALLGSGSCSRCCSPLLGVGLDPEKRPASTSARAAAVVAAVAKPTTAVVAAAAAKPTSVAVVAAAATPSHFGAAAAAAAAAAGVVAAQRLLLWPHRVAGGVVALLATSPRCQRRLHRLAAGLARFRWQRCAPAPSHAPPPVPKLARRRSAPFFGWFVRALKPCTQSHGRSHLHLLPTGCL